jgi:hypothetical protein
LKESCDPVFASRSKAAAPITNRQTAIQPNGGQMEYSTFKSLQALLFFGSAMGFCLWQLAVIRRIRREDAEAREKEQAGTPGAATILSAQSVETR